MATRHSFRKTTKRCSENTGGKSRRRRNVPTGVGRAMTSQTSFSWRPWFKMSSCALFASDPLKSCVFNFGSSRNRCRTHRSRLRSSAQFLVASKPDRRTWPCSLRRIVFLHCVVRRSSNEHAWCGRRGPNGDAIAVARPQDSPTSAEKGHTAAHLEVRQALPSRAHFFLDRRHSRRHYLVGVAVVATRNHRRGHSSPPRPPRHWTRRRHGDSRNIRRGFTDGRAKNLRHYRRGAHLRPAGRGLSPHSRDAHCFLFENPDRGLDKSAEQRRHRRPAGVHGPLF